MLRILLVLVALALAGCAEDPVMSPTSSTASLEAPHDEVLAGPDVEAITDHAPKSPDLVLHIPSPEASLPFAHWPREDGWWSFQAAYANTTNDTRLTLDLDGPVKVRASDGRNVSAYRLIERKWFANNHTEERIHYLSNEGRVLRMDEQPCVGRAGWHPICSLEQHRQATRIVAYMSEGGVPPHGVLWPQMMARDGHLISWAYGRATVLADAAVPVGARAQIDVVVPSGQILHGTSNASFLYDEGLPVPAKIGGLDLRSFVVTNPIHGADPLVNATFRVRPPTPIATPDWFPGATRVGPPAPMSIADAIVEAAEFRPEVRDAECISTFVWHSLPTALGPTSPTVSAIVVDPSSPNGTLSFHIALRTMPDGSEDRITLSARRAGPDVCPGIATAALPVADPWDILGVGEATLGLPAANLSRIGFLVFGAGTFGTPPENGWLLSYAIVDGVEFGWNPSSGRLTHVIAPAEFAV